MLEAVMLSKPGIGPSEEPKPESKFKITPLCMSSIIVLSTIGASIIGMALTINEAASKIAETVVVSQEVVHKINDVQWTVWTFVGAILAVATTMLLRKESLRENFGRGIGAAVTGIAFPRLTTYAHPWVKELTNDFILLVLFGYLCGMIGFALVKAFVDFAASRSIKVVNRVGDEWIERKIRPRQEEPKDAP